ncbi:ABC transporter permease [Rhodococcoides trifolii]|uniref:ABC transporter permease n=2 Tax=Rhodococcoides trifolii TaxID=908250 RepID=A0A917LGY3_9NOCA|nr:ABC transporter permease [Rhodococcus trifolii]
MSTTTEERVTRGESAYGAGRSIVGFLVPILIAFVMLLVIWVVFLNAFPQVGPRVGKTPADVWEYLFTGSRSAEARSSVFGNLRITLRDAGVGFVVGMGGALIIAAVFVLFRSVEQTFMPVAMLLRSVPLVALTPIIVLIFGRGIVGVTAMVAIVVFFPALVMIMVGLRQAPRQAQDLIAAYGGNSWTAMRMVAVPSALPSVFAAARISVPGALIGALIGEWLGSGRGLGSSMIKSIPKYQYNELWSSIVVITVVSIVLYAVVGVFEKIALARFGPNAGKT